MNLPITKPRFTVVFLIFTDPIPKAKGSNKTEREVFDAYKFYSFREIQIRGNRVSQQPNSPTLGFLLNHQICCANAHYGNKRIQVGKCAGFVENRWKKFMEITG